MDTLHKATATARCNSDCATVTIGSGTTYRALAEILLGLLERHLEYVWTETG